MSNRMQMWGVGFVLIIGWFASLYYNEKHPTRYTIPEEQFRAYFQHLPPKEREQWMYRAALEETFNTNNNTKKQIP